MFTLDGLSIVPREPQIMAQQVDVQLVELVMMSKQSARTLPRT
jgi:hypothetical protein